MEKIYGLLIKEILLGSTKATKYVSEKLTIKATRRHFTKRQIEIHFTIGKPNYLERKFIKMAKKAGEPFPIRKIQIKK